MVFPADLKNKYSEYPALKSFGDYIEELIAKSDTDIPCKDDLRPFDMKTFVPSLVLYEMIDKEHVKLRLVGTEAELILGFGSTNINVFDILLEESRDAVAWFFDTVAQYKCATWQDEELVLDNGLVIDCITFGVPLLDKEGEPKFRLSSTFISNKSWAYEREENRPKVTHRSISAIEYYDLGYGVPDTVTTPNAIAQKVRPKYRKIS